MLSRFETLLNAVRSLLVTSNNRVRQIVSGGPGDKASMADVTTRLEGFTLPQVRQQISEPITNHDQSRSNPHEDQAALVGLYTRSEVDSLIQSVIPRGILPISRYGDLGPTGITATYSGWSVTIEDAVPSIIAGRDQVVASSTISLSSLFSDVGNRTFHLYLVLVGDDIRYQVRSALETDTNIAMRIGRIVTSASGITEVTLCKVTGLLDNYRIYTYSDGTVGVTL